MWRLSYWMLRAVSGIFFWFRRRVTPAGKVAVGIALVAAALGVDTSQTLAYQIFALIIAALVLGLLAARAMRPRFEVRRVAPRVVTAGQAFSYRVWVRNLGSRPADGLSYSEQTPDPRPSLGEFRGKLKWPTYRGWWRLVMQAQPADVEDARIPPLLPGAQVMLELRGQARRRGTFQLTGANVAQAEPLGLVRALARVRLPDAMVVLPRRYKLHPAQLAGARRYQHGGVSLANSVGDSEEFIGLRLYRPGDPLQRIHWKSFARRGEPVVREYQDEFFERHALVLDTFADARQSEAFEEAVSVAASYACTLDTQESLLDLLFVGTQAYSYTAGRGQLQTGQLVEILAGVRASTGQRFSLLAEAVLARRGALSGCTLILLDCEAARIELVQRLRAGGVPLQILLVSALQTPDAPAGWHHLIPGRIQEGLAAL